MKAFFITLFLFTVLILKLSYNLDIFLLSKMRVKKIILVLSISIIIDAIYICVINILFLNIIALIVIILTVYRIIELIIKIKKI